MNFSIAGIISYFLAFFWGIFILISLGGWGGILNRILFPKQPIDWGQKGAWGLAFTIFVGGILNLTWTISLTTILIYLGCGFVYGMWELFQDRDTIARSLDRLRELRGKPLILAGVIFLALLLLIRYAGSVHAIIFNIHDDNHAYLAYPYKMLQMGSLGPDPYSERRLVSALGGQSFLDSIMVSWLPVENIKITERGYGLVLAIAGLIGYLKDKKTSLVTSLIVVFLALFSEPPSVNISSLIIPIPLFISLFRVLEGGHLKNHNIFSNAIIIALLGTSICTLKNNLIVPVVLLLVVSYLLYIINSQDKRQAISECGLAMVFSGLFLLPWMLSLYQSSGTLLYPFLGKGYHGSTYGTFAADHTFDSVGSLIKIFVSRHNLLFYLTTILSIICFTNKLLWQEKDHRKAMMSLAVSGVLATAIVIFATAGVAGERYTFSFRIVVFLVLLAAILEMPSGDNLSKFPKSRSGFLALIISGIVVVNGLGGFIYTYRVAVGATRRGLQQVSLVPETLKVQHQKMQQSIPEGVSIMTRLERAFLMDFKRNQVFLCDWPGGASLPPGMPMFQGGEPLANYFLSHSIRYVVYSYATQAAYPPENHVIQPGDSNWVVSATSQTLDFQKNLAELGTTRQRIYDDGDIWAIDLQSKVNPS